MYMYACTVVMACVHCRHGMRALPHCRHGIKRKVWAIGVWTYGFTLYRAQGTRIKERDKEKTSQTQTATDWRAREPNVVVADQTFNFKA